MSIVLKGCFLILTLASLLNINLGLETNSKLHIIRLLYMEGELLDLGRNVLKKDEHFNENIAQNEALEDYHDFRKVEK